MIAISLVVVQAVALGAASDDRAAVVMFDSSPVDATTGVKVTEFFVGDDFSPDLSAEATTVTFELGDWNGDFPALFDGLIRWSFHLNDLGDPGQEIARGTAIDVSYTQAFPPDGCVYSACYDVQFNLGQQVELSDTFLYWLVLNVNHGHSASQNHSWLKASVPNSNHAHFRTATGLWSDAGFSLTFTVIADTTVTYLFTDGFETGDALEWSLNVQ